MSPDPSAETPAAELTKPLRPIAAFVLLGVNAVWLLIDVQRYLLPPSASPYTFSERSSGAFGDFTGLVTAVGLPLLAVMLATHIAPVLAQARIIVLAALGEFAFAGLFAVISFLAALFGASSVRAGFEGVFIRLGSFALFAVAALVVFRVAQPMLANAAPKEDRLSQYGRGGFDPYAGQEPQQSTYGGAYGSPQQSGPYGQQAAYGEQQPTYGEQPAAYGEPPQPTYGEQPVYGEHQQPAAYGESVQPTTYGEPVQPTTYGEQPQYTQQFPPQQYGGETSGSYQQSGGGYAPTSQVYGGTPQQSSAPPAWEQRSQAQSFPPQPPGGWPAQQPGQQPSSGGVYGGEPSWPGQQSQQPGYEDEIQATQLMSPEARLRAEEARRAANQHDPNWFDKR